MSFPFIISLKMPTILMKQNHVFLNITDERIIYMFLFRGTLFHGILSPKQRHQTRDHRMAIAVLELALYIRLVRYLHASAS